MHLEQTIAALRFDPAVPVWLLVLLGLLCLVALAPALWARARGAVLRAAGFAVLLAWLSGPRLIEETRTSLPDIGLLVVDQTASMQIGKRTALAEAARKAIAGQAARFPDLELRSVVVPEGGDGGTRLFATVARALADIPPGRLAGVVAITDGQVHDIPPPERLASLLGGAPLQVLIPARGEETDRRIRVIAAPSYGIVGHPVTLKVAIDDLGVAHPAATARLTIRRDGERPVTETVPVGAAHEIELPITRAGLTVVELSAEALPGEVSALNNRTVVAINGVRDRLRVLLVSGEPHAGERTWRRLLKADPAVDLVHFTILRPPEKDDLTPLNELALIAFPVRELFLVKLREFDLIILDRFQNRGLLPMPYLRNIADYVRDGGALLMSVWPEFAGPGSLANTPLAAAIPARPVAGEAGVIEGPFRPHVTDVGARHPVTEALPGAPSGPGPAPAQDPAPAPGPRAGPAPAGDPAWGEWYRRIEASSVEGDTVMSAPDGSPLLVLDHIGEGRAALLLSDQIWLGARGHEGGGPQAELLRRLAHWLMKEPGLEENALTATVENGVLSIAQRSTAETPPAEISVTDPDGASRTLKLARLGPGRAGASLQAGIPGVWRASDGTRTAYAAVGAANPLEFADMRATASLMGPPARASLGGVHWLDDGTAQGSPPALRRVEVGHDASGASWIGLARRHDHLVSGIAGLPLLPPWLALPLILGLVVGAWRREGGA